jgi:hypothetical protein
MQRCPSTRVRSSAFPAARASRPRCCTWLTSGRSDSATGCKRTVSFGLPNKQIVKNYQRRKINFIYAGKWKLFSQQPRQPQSPNCSLRERIPPTKLSSHSFNGKSTPSNFRYMCFFSSQFLPNAGVREPNSEACRLVVRFSRGVVKVFSPNVNGGVVSFDKLAAQIGASIHGAQLFHQTVQVAPRRRLLMTNL